MGAGKWPPLNTFLLTADPKLGPKNGPHFLLVGGSVIAQKSHEKRTPAQTFYSLEAFRRASSGGTLSRAGMEPKVMFQRRRHLLNHWSWLFCFVLVGSKGKQ